MKTTALTAYGKVGTDWVRLTAVILESGDYALRRADGSDTIIPVLPSTFRTCGDITSAAAKMGKRTLVAAVPSVGLAKHAWKPEYDLADIALHMVGDKAKASAIVVGLLATYMDDEIELAA